MWTKPNKQKYIGLINKYIQLHIINMLKAIDEQIKRDDEQKNATKGSDHQRIRSGGGHAERAEADFTAKHCSA